jgi:hypothetical protein
LFGGDLGKNPRQLAATGQHVVGPLQTGVDAEAGHRIDDGHTGCQRKPPPGVGGHAIGIDRHRHRDLGVPRRRPAAPLPAATGGLVFGDENGSRDGSAAIGPRDQVGVGGTRFGDHLHRSPHRAADAEDAFAQRRFIERSTLSSHRVHPR